MISIVNDKQIFKNNKEKVAKSHKPTLKEKITNYYSRENGLKVHDDGCAICTTGLIGMAGFGTGTLFSSLLSRTDASLEVVVAMCMLAQLISAVAFLWGLVQAIIGKNLEQ